MLIALLYPNAPHQTPFPIESPESVIFDRHPNYEHPVAFVAPATATAFLKAFPSVFETEKFATQTELAQVLTRLARLEERAGIATADPEPARRSRRKVEV